MSVSMTIFNVLFGLAQVAAEPKVVPICTAAGDQVFPQISGKFVVWTDKRDGGLGDIYGYNLETLKEFIVADGMVQRGGPMISGDVVVWIDGRNGDRDIYGKNLVSNQEFAVATGPALQQGPSISGNIVVWEDETNGNVDVRGYDLSTQRYFTVADGPARQIRPAVSGDIVVWQVENGADSDIYGYDIKTRAAFAIATGPHSYGGPKISGRTVLYSGGGSTFAYDLTTKRETSLGAGGSASIDGDLVVWQISGNIFGCHLPSRASFPINTAPRFSSFPTVSGDRVVWHDNGSGRFDVYSAVIPKEKLLQAEVEPKEEAKSAQLAKMKSNPKATGQAKAVAATDDPEPDMDGEPPKGRSAAKKKTPANDDDPADETESGGVGRKAALLKSRGDDKPAKADFEKAKVKRLLAKRLGSKEDRIFVFQTLEISQEAPEEDDDEPVRPSEKMEVEIVQGRQNAVDHLANFLTEHGSSATTSRRSRKSKEAVVSPPPPRRDWKPLGDFANNEVGNRQAQDLRARAIRIWKAQKRAREQMEDGDR